MKIFIFRTIVLETLRGKRNKNTSTGGENLSDLQKPRKIIYSLLNLFCRKVNYLSYNSVIIYKKLINVLWRHWKRPQSFTSVERRHLWLKGPHSLVLSMDHALFLNVNFRFHRSSSFTSLSFYTFRSFYLF